MSQKKQRLTVVAGDRRKHVVPVSMDTTVDRLREMLTERSIIANLEDKSTTLLCDSHGAILNGSDALFDVIDDLTVCVSEAPPAPPLSTSQEQLPPPPPPAAAGAAAAEPTTMTTTTTTSTTTSTTATGTVVVSLSQDEQEQEHEMTESVKVNYKLCGGLSGAVVVSVADMAKLTPHDLSDLIMDDATADDKDDESLPDCLRYRKGEVTLALFHQPNGIPLVHDGASKGVFLKDCFGGDSLGIAVEAIPFVDELKQQTASAGDASAPTEPATTLDPNVGSVQIFVKGQKTYTVAVDPSDHTVLCLKRKIKSKTGIPCLAQRLSYSAHVLSNDSLKLSDYNVQRDLTIHLNVAMSLHGVGDGGGGGGGGAGTASGFQSNFVALPEAPTRSQAIEGLAQFYAVLYVMTERLCETLKRPVLAALRRRNASAACVAGIDGLLHRMVLTKASKIAVVEGLYEVFRAMIPSDPRDAPGSALSSTLDHAVFDASRLCWLQIIGEAEAIKATSLVARETFVRQDLSCPVKIGEPLTTTAVKVPSWSPKYPGVVMSRAAALELITELETAKSAAEAAATEQPMHGTGSLDNEDGSDDAIECDGNNNGDGDDEEQGSTAPAKSLTESDLERPDRQLLALIASRHGLPENRRMDCRVWRPSSSSSSSSSAAVEQLPAVAMGAAIPWRLLGNVSPTDSNLKILTAYKPLALKSRPTAPCLSVHPTTFHAAVFTGSRKDSAASLDLFDPITGSSVGGNADEMAARQSGGVGLAADDASAAGSLTRTAREAIVVLLDVSGSMQMSWGPDNLSRLDVVKQCFVAMANRSMAYNLPHVIGLTTFNHKVGKALSMSEHFESFKSTIDKAEAEYQTALFDALDNAAEQLKTFMGALPAEHTPSEGVLKRIMVLTDGEDTASKMAPHTVARKLQDEQIVVDTVLIGNGGGDDDFNPVRAITAACGGVTFKPETISEALQLFEQETVLSLRERSGVAPQEAVRSRVDLQQRQLALPVFATRPPRHQPVQLELAAARAQELLRRYRSATPSSASSSAASSSSRTNPLRIKRLLREMARYERDPHPFIEAFPCEDDMSFWQFILIGPNQTPYEGGCFTLWASFPDSYPAHAMEMRFTTPIYHCNINSTGKVCHSVFDRNWTSDMSVRQVLDCVYGLLLHPEPDDPLDSVLAAKFYENRAEYDSCAVMATNKYARQETPEQCRARLLKEGDDETAAAAGSTKGAVASGIPEFLVCPLTLELFKDPVVTPHGHTFERTAIEAAIVAQGKCPLSRQPLTSEQLVANYAIKGAVAEHKKVMAQTPWWEDD